MFATDEDSCCCTHGESVWDAVFNNPDFTYFSLLVQLHLPDVELPVCDVTITPFTDDAWNTLEAQTQMGLIAFDWIANPILKLHIFDGAMDSEALLKYREVPSLLEYPVQQSVNFFYHEGDIPGVAGPAYNFAHHTNVGHFVGHWDWEVDGGYVHPINRILTPMACEQDPIPEDNRVEAMLWDWKVAVPDPTFTCTGMYLQDFDCNTDQFPALYLADDHYPGNNELDKDNRQQGLPNTFRAFFEDGPEAKSSQNCAGGQWDAARAPRDDNYGSGKVQRLSNIDQTDDLCVKMCNEKFFAHWGYYSTFE